MAPQHEPTPRANVPGGSAQRADRRRGESDRRTEKRYRFQELRTGFDRRRPSLILGTMRERDWILLLVLALTNLLSLADGYLTFMEVSLGVAQEGNPLLASLYELHPLSAVAFKVLVIVLVSGIIWAKRQYRSMLALSIFACCIYTAVIAYHLGHFAGFGWV